MVNTREYAPNYFIRILSADGEINLNNVVSISTSKDINGDTGSFEIVLDYNQFVLDPSLNKDAIVNKITYSQESIFFSIKPMDYIEIYLARDAQQDLGRNYGFGIYDENGEFIRNFDEVYDSTKKEYVRLKSTQTTDLNIIDRVNNPHLVFCGFVDGIRNNFQISENGTNNSVTIFGKCLAKYLALHYIYYNFPYSDIFIQQVNGAFSLLGLKPNEAIDMVLTRFCVKFFTKNVVEINQVDYDNKAKFKQLSAGKFPDSIIIWNEKNSNTGSNNYFTKVIHNAVPSFKYLFWGTSITSALKGKVSSSEITSQNGYYKWGRMQFINTINGSILNVSADSPVLSVLKQGAQIPYNDFFIDEIGNITLRQALDGWDYNSGINLKTIDYTDPFTGKPAKKIYKEFAKDPNTYIKDWVELEQSDIRGWSFQISDNELKTVVVDVPVASVLGSQPIITGIVGVAPVSKLSLGSMLDAEKNKVSGESKIKNTASEKAKLEQTFKTIESQQSNHLDGYDLSTDDGILKFWGRFGLRPMTINDIYSDSFSRFYESAWSLFQKYANYWWKGTFTVKGDSKYKIGQKGKIRDFAMDSNGNIKDFNFYIQAINHNYAWGSDWTTTISFTRGEIEGTTTSQNTSAIGKK